MEYLISISLYTGKTMILDFDHNSHRISSVMDIFRSRFYRLNVILLSMLGLWPYQKRKTWQLFQQITCQISVVSIMLPEIIKALEEWGDLDIMIQCLTPMGVQLFTCVKSINYFVHRKQMTKLLEAIKRDWSDLKNEKEIEILTKYADRGRILTISYIVFIYLTVFIYLMIPLLPRLLDVIVPLNESRPPAYPFPTQYYVDPEEYSMWILLHTYLGTVVVVSIMIAADTMFACYVMHVCGILAVIGYRLENLTPTCTDTDTDVNIMSKADNDRCRQEILRCIDDHYKATEVANIIESSYSMSYLLVLGICVFILSISAVQLLIKFGNIEETIRLAEFNFAQCGHLLFSSWPCQKLIDQCEHFRESLYASEWYSLSKGNKDLLRFVMLRTLKPQKITAGKLYDMSIENFGVVIQTSISYFMVFASMR